MDTVQPRTISAELRGAFLPPPISHVEDTGLSPLWLQDLTLKILYFQGYLTGFKIAEEIALPFAGVMDQILETLKREKLVEVKSSQMGLGEGSYQYAITGAGIGKTYLPGSWQLREACSFPEHAPHTKHPPTPVPIWAPE